MDKTSYLTSILPGFLIAVGVGDAIHLQTLVEDELRANHPLPVAFRRALKYCYRPFALHHPHNDSRPIVILLCINPAVRSLGLYGAIGVVIAFVLTLMVLPLTLNSRSASREWMHKTPAKLQLLSKNHSKIILMTMSTLIVLAAIGLSRLETTHNPKSWVPQDWPIVQVLNVMDRHFGGSIEVDLMVTFQDNLHALSPRAVRDISSLNDQFIEQSSVPVSLTSGTPLVLNHLGLPLDELGSGTDKTNIFTQLDVVSPDWSDGILSESGVHRLNYRLPWKPAEKFSDIPAVIDDLDQANSRYEVSATGTESPCLQHSGVCCST